MTAATVLADLRKRLSVIKDAYVLTIPPPPVQGLGSAGGFKLMVQDRAGLGSDALAHAAQALVAAANRDPDFAGVFTLFSTRSPTVYTDIDREKAEKVGLTPTDVFSTLQVYLGSQYVNDFNYLGRTYQVIAQADGSFRRDAADIQRLKARNSAGEMVPIGTVARLRDETAAYRVPRFDLFPAAEVMGVAAPGVATGTALHRMEELAHQVLPPGIGFEWTELAFQQQQKGTPTLLVLGAAALLVFLVLAAQYESWKLPLAVVLIVADVPAGFGDRPAGPRDVHRCPGPDRLRGSRGVGRQERDPHRRIRAPGGGGGCDRRRSRGARGTYAASSDPDDLPGLHPRRRPAGGRDRRRIRDAPIPRHGGVLRDAGRDRLRPAVHARLLHRRPSDRRPAARARRGRDPDVGRRSPGFVRWRDRDGSRATSGIRHGV